jgi:hypothetical protein
MMHVACGVILKFSRRADKRRELCLYQPEKSCMWNEVRGPRRARFFSHGIMVEYEGIRLGKNMRGDRKYSGPRQAICICMYVPRPTPNISLFLPREVGI